MSIKDNKVPLLSAPWLNPTGQRHPVTPLPGLHPQAIQDLESSYPGTLSTVMRSLLGTSSGLAGSELGSVDFTSRWYPEEPLAVFRPCLTLAVDDEGRRWIAETSRRDGLPGPVWSIFPDPAVAVFVSEDLAGLLATLHENALCGRTVGWLRSLSAKARTVWAQRRTLALRSQHRCQSDPATRRWLEAIPFDASVFDLRPPFPACGWPYGLAGPDGQLFRCGRLPAFAVAGRSSRSRWSHHMSAIAKTHELLRPAVARQGLS